MKNKKRIMNTFLDILYPRHCPVCHNIIGFRGQKICDSCREELKPVTGPRCYKCSRPLSDSGQEYCRDCSSRRHFFEQGTGIFPYSTLLQESLYKLKYEKRQEYGTFYGELGALLAKEQISRWKIDIIVPIPLHRKRLEKRGYNQAELIAEAVGERLDLPVDKALLKRKVNTCPQKDLGPVERKANLKNAFISKGRLEGGNVLLVDDIYTTGATVDEAARILIKAGADRVYFLVIAIGSGA